MGIPKRDKYIGAIKRHTRFGKSRDVNIHSGEIRNVNKNSGGIKHEESQPLVKERANSDRLQIAVEQLDNGGLKIGRIPLGIPSPLEIHHR